MKKIGIYTPYLETKGGGEKMSLALAEYFARNPNNSVFMVAHDKVDLKDLGTYFSIDLSRVKTLIIKTDNIFLKFIARLPLPSMARSFFFDLVRLRKLKKQDFGLFINNMVFSNMAAPCENSAYLCMFPQKIDSKDKDIGLAKKIYLIIMNTLYRFTMHPSKKFGVHTYRQIVAISEFTKSHIRQRWGLDSAVLYPICDGMRLPSPLQKEKIILHVGRFFARDGGNHHKRQDMLLEEFAKMDKLHKDGWELHFAGSVAQDASALKYILKLMKKAEELPVYFHFNCSFPELKTLYNKATIYWHATGFGSDPERQPERQEHFGISTVEAMSTGTVPVVIDTAGQKESVIHAENGFLWSTKKELADYTTKVANMSPDELGAMQAAAIKTAIRFNKAAFEKRVDTIFGEILS